MAEKGFTLTEPDIRRIIRSVLATEMGRQNVSANVPPSSRGVTSQANKPRFNLARNLSAEEVPAFGVSSIAGTEDDAELVQRFTIDKPSGSGPYLICGRDKIPSTSEAGLGAVSCDWPVEALYDTADTPAVGEEWGPQPDSFLLHKGGAGFEIVGSPLTDPDGVSRPRVRVKAKSEATVKWAKAQSNWQNSSPCPKVSVKDCDDCAGAGETGDAFDVQLPRAGGQDPNVVTGEVIGYRTAEDGTKACVTDYLDDKILTWKGFSDDDANIAAGWALMNGVANSVVNGGSGIDFQDFYPKGKPGGGAPDNTAGGTLNHDHTGVTDTGGGGSFDSDCKVTGITIDDHPDHFHEPDDTPYKMAEDLAALDRLPALNCTSGVRVPDSGNNCALPGVLSHVVVEPSCKVSFEGHFHTTTVPSHNHGIQSDVHDPRHKKTNFIERIDNSFTPPP